MEAWHDYFRVDIEIPNAERVSVTDDSLSVELGDGRSISVPLAWFPQLIDLALSQVADITKKGRE